MSKEEALSKEIDEMLGDMIIDSESKPPSEEVPASDEKELEEKKLEEEEKEETSEEEASKEIPLKKEDDDEEPPPKVDEEPLAEEETFTVEELQARIKKLTERVEELTPSQFEELPKPKKEPKKDEPKKDEDDQEVSDKLVPVKEFDKNVDFLGEATVDDLIDDRELFNGVLNSVFANAVETSKNLIFEKVLLSIPEIVTGHISRQATIGKLVGDFYDANKDLVSVKRTVGAVANNLHAENPDWKVDEVFNKAAEKTREVLGLKKPVEKIENKEFSEDPAFVGSKSGKPPTRKSLGTLQDEIDDFINE